MGLKLAARDYVARQDGVADRAILLDLAVAHIWRLHELFYFVNRPTALLLKGLCLEQVLLRTMAGDLHMRV